MHFSYLSVKRTIQFAILYFGCPAPARQCFGSVERAGAHDCTGAPKAHALRPASRTETSQITDK